MKSAGLKANGRLKKGYRYSSGGRVVKAKASTKTARGRRTALRRDSRGRFVKRRICK